MTRRFFACLPLLGIFFRPAKVATFCDSYWKPFLLCPDGLWKLTSADAKGWPSYTRIAWPHQHLYRAYAYLQDLRNPVIWEGVPYRDGYGDLAVDQQRRDGHFDRRILERAKAV